MILVGFTELVSWVHEHKIPVAWFSLDKADNDPMHFLAYVILGLQGLESKGGRAAVKMLQSPQPPPIESILISLINDLMVQWKKEIGAIPGVKSLTFAGFGDGPAGAPIEVWLQGRDMNDLLAAADDLMDRLRMFEGVYQIHNDLILNNHAKIF